MFKNVCSVASKRALTFREYVKKIEQSGGAREKDKIQSSSYFMPKILGPFYIVTYS